jgi:hypothetical protein
VQAVEVVLAQQLLVQAVVEEVVLPAPQPQVRQL